jgi:hypothetical protein
MLPGSRLAALACAAALLAPGAPAAPLALAAPAAPLALAAPAARLAPAAPPASASPLAQAAPAASAAPAAPAAAPPAAQESERPAEPVASGLPPLPAPIGGAALRWRLVGPFRGGRVLAVCGVPGQPESFFFGAVGGGVWRSDDAGRVWKPVFDGPPSGSIGALAVAPSDPNVVYAGSGEADMRSDVSYGDGMYRSSDGGRSFQPIGLRDSRQIGRILVDPHDPDLVLVAALGHGFGPNPERGVFRSADGGKSWRRVLYRDAGTGAIDLAADPDDPRTVVAALWNVRRPPWSTYAPLGGPGGGLFLSHDGGLTWREIAGHGLPAGPFGRIGLAFAGGRPGQRGRRIYALIDDPREAGLYRSDDAGASWRRVGADRRVTSRPWYFGGLTAHPRDPDIVYVANVSLYRSTDGGSTFDPFKGAPGGDDYHALWIDPGEPRRMILGSDQGAAVSVDGGATWSSWFNQPTAQLYHVATDDRYPYTIYGAQQDSGTVAVVSRSDMGQITFRDWFSTGTGESGYLLPDPADPDVVYGGNTFGQLFRFSRRTNQVQDVSPTPGPPGGGLAGRFRYPWTPALAISPHPPHALYQGSQYVHRSTDGGMSWTVISPDLTVRQGSRGARGRAAGDRDADRDRDPHRGRTLDPARESDRDRAVVYSLAPSPVLPGLLWAGTDNGLIHLTRDEGRTWREVTPPGLAAWSMVSLIEPSRFDAGTAYVAIDRHQMDDLRPYALRTRDFGHSWTPIAAGIPAGAYVHAVREDPRRRGLLYAATETGVYLSFDDGDRWQPLQLNLPAASVRDLAVHGDDLIAATHGRSFWVLDGLAPLRQLDAAAVASPLHLFTPAPAVRRRRGENRESPLPPETPAGANPPAGALIDYWLAAGAAAVPAAGRDQAPPSGKQEGSSAGAAGHAEPAAEVVLEIFDEHGERVRRFSSSDPVPRPAGAEPLVFPAYWLRPPPPLPSRAGLNRFVWDLRYPPPPRLHPQGSMDAVYGQDTPFEPEGPLVLPGTYRLRLTAGSHTSTAPLRVEVDPRLTVSPEALASQLALSRRLDAALAESYQAVQQLRDLDRRLERLAASLVPSGPITSSRPVSKRSGGRDRELAAAVAALRRRIDDLAGREREFREEPERDPGLTAIHGGLAALAVTVGTGDAAPTAQAAAAFSAWRALLDRRLAAWSSLRATDLPALDRRLAARGLPALAGPR